MRPLRMRREPYTDDGGFLVQSQVDRADEGGIC